MSGSGGGQISEANANQGTKTRRVVGTRNSERRATRRHGDRCFSSSAAAAADVTRVGGDAEGDGRQATASVCFHRTGKARVAGR